MDKKIVNNLDSFNSLLNQCKYQEQLEEKYPNIFILGIPRSGTTLLNQILAYSLDIGYINNLIARFWDAPFIGALLSKDLGLTKDFQFNSKQGFTKEISNVHEFGFFWKKYFNKKCERDAYLDDLNSKEINWKDWRDDILRLNSVYEKPFVFKAINILPYIDHVKKILKKSIFVIIDRDPYDNAVSILNARKKIKGDTKKWWSFKPYKNFDFISKQSPEEQIAYQIKYIKDLISKQFSKKDKNVIYLKYKNICLNPEKELLKISKFFNSIIKNKRNLKKLNLKNYNKSNKLIISRLKKYKLM